MNLKDLIYDYDCFMNEVGMHKARIDEIDENIYNLENLKSKLKKSNNENKEVLEEIENQVKKLKDRKVANINYLYKAEGKVDLIEETIFDLLGVD